MMKQYRNVFLIAIILLFTCSIGYAQDVPADFGDVIDDNPDDAPITNYFWIVSMIAFTLVYLFRKKYFKKVQG